MINPTPTDTTLDLEEAMGEVEIQAFKKRSVSGAVSYTLRSLVLYGIGFITSLVLSAQLSIEAFGIYGLVTQIVGLLQLFSDIGLGPILIQQKSEPTKEQYQTVFSVQLLLSFILFAVILGVSQLPVVQARLGIQGIWVLLALGLTLPLGTLKTISANILERKLDFNKLVIPNIFEQVAYNAILIYLALSGLGVISFAYAVLARLVVGIVSMWVLQPWPIGLHIKRDYLKSILHLGTGFQGSNILAAIKDQIFYIFLGFWLTPTQFGMISWSKQWSQVPYMLTVQNVIAITFPAYSRLQHDKARLGKAIEKTLFFITLSIFPILVGMSVFIYPVTQVIGKYSKWEPAVWTFVMFTLSIAWAAISTPLTNTLNAIGKVSITLKLMTMWTILTWGLTFWLLKYVGFNGVALAALLISFTSYLPVYYVKQLVPFNLWSNVWRQLLAAIVMGLVGLIGMNYWSANLMQMLVGIVIVGATYLLVVGVLGYKKILAEVRSLR